MKILIEKYGPYFLTQKTVAFDKYGLNYSVELESRSVTSVTVVDYSVFTSSTHPVICECSL